LLPFSRHIPISGPFTPRAGSLPLLPFVFRFSEFRSAKALMVERPGPRRKGQFGAGLRIGLSRSRGAGFFSAGAATNVSVETQLVVWRPESAWGYLFFPDSLLDPRRTPFPLLAQPFLHFSDTTPPLLRPPHDSQPPSDPLFLPCVSFPFMVPPLSSRRTGPHTPYPGLRVTSINVPRSGLEDPLVGFGPSGLRFHYAR